MFREKLSPHFDLKEFRCMKEYQDCPYCGGSIRVRNITVYRAGVTPLEILRWNLRQRYGEIIEIIVSSGDRCRKRNCEVSTMSNPELSWHWRGCAIDIFARTKKDRVIVSLDVLYDETIKLWPADWVALEGDHIHITLMEVYK